MTTVALALVLFAAVAHAGWNYLAKTASGGTGFAWLYAIGDSALLAPFAVAFLASSGAPPLGTATLLTLGSGVLHAGYAVLLQRSYREADLSFVYPLARGIGPLLATLVAIAAFGERPTPLALAGAAVIVGSIFVLAGLRLSSAETGGNDGLQSAVLTGVFIAAYTLWDKHAVDSQGLSPLLYLWGSSTFRAVLLVPFAGRRFRLVRRTWRAHRQQVVAVSVLSSTAYLLVLYALTLAPVSYVAPARELSVLIGVALGAQLLSEAHARRRIACATAVVAGVMALALG